MEKDVFSNWEAEHNPYKQNMVILARLYTIYLSQDSCQLDNEANIVMSPGVKPLHVKWHTIYHAILKLDSESVFEFGFGFGHNLHNLQELRPNIRVKGIDIAVKQYKHAILILPKLKQDLFIWDAADRLDACHDNSVDVAFSRGVIMFLARHIEVIHNMFSVANKQVILLEDWGAHNFYDDIKEYSLSSQFSWPNVYFYSYDTGVTEQNGGSIKAMVCSRDPILQEWAVPLSSDQQLRGA